MMSEPGVWSVVTFTRTTGSRHSAVHWDLPGRTHHWVDVNGNWMEWADLADAQPEVIAGRWRKITEEEERADSLAWP